MSKQTILIVDDSKLSRMILSRFVLEYQPTWDIIEAENAEEALALSEGKDIEWMTIDYNMPGMDGITLAQNFVLTHENSNITLLTADIQTSVREEANKLGISLIEKPITEEKVREFIGGVKK